MEPMGPGSLHEAGSHRDLCSPIIVSLECLPNSLKIGESRILINYERPLECRKESYTLNCNSYGRALCNDQCNGNDHALLDLFGVNEWFKANMTYDTYSLSYTSSIAKKLKGL